MYLGRGNIKANVLRLYAQSGPDPVKQVRMHTRKRSTPGDTGARNLTFLGLFDLGHWIRTDEVT